MLILWTLAACCYVAWNADTLIFEWGDANWWQMLLAAGFSIALIREAFVYHKRRISMKLFFKQVYVFGMSRITLYLLYPDSLKAVHWLPAVFVLGVIALIILSLAISWMFIIPLAAYVIAIFVCASVSTKNIKIGALSIIASIIQLSGYGIGFLKAFCNKILLRKGRNVEEEIAIRKGK